MMRRLIALLIMALAALALAGPAGAGAPERSWVKGPFAAGVLTDFREDAPPGTVFTDIDVFGVDEVTRENGTKTADQTVFVNIFRYTADAGGDVVAIYEGSFPAAVTVDKKFATASVTATGVQLTCDDDSPAPCVPPAPFDLEAQFTAIGPPTKDVLNFHFVTEGSRFVFHSAQRGRPATVEVSIDGVPFAGTVLDGFIGDAHSGEICRRPC